MTEYRVDTMATGSQRPVIYLHGVGTVKGNADVTIFLDSNNEIIAVAPVSSNIAYVAI